MVSSQPSFISELYLPSFVSKLDAVDLQNIQDGLLSRSDICKPDFCDLLATILSKGDKDDYEQLFDLVDTSRQGYINWDIFSSHLLLEYYEKEDRIRHSKVPQWVGLKYIPVPHRSCICAIKLSSLSYRYCTVSKDGMMCLIDRNFKVIRSSQVSTDPEQIRAKDLWITDAALIQHINKIVFTNTSKEILIYDLSNKSQFNCIYIIRGLKYIPMCITYWSNPENVNHATMAFGDVDGGVHVLFFKNATLSLFDKPLKDSDQQICFELNINEVINGKFPSVSYMFYKAHSSWVRKLCYQPFLDCIISSSTTSKDSMVLGWLGKARNDFRLSTFSIAVGINGFDYNEKMFLIATAGINNQICLWNPYVVSKAVGNLEGHVQVVLAVQFICSNSQLISFSKDNVLRVWDVSNQTCLQTLTCVFPCSMTSDILITFDDECSSMLASLNHQLVVMKKKMELKDRVVSHASPVTCVAYNKKYNQIVSVCEGSSIIIWLLSTGQKVKHISNAHGDAEITTVTFDHSDTYILTGGTDGNIKRWDTNGNCLNVLVVDGGRPCEINKIIYLKRIILAFGWSKTICCFSITGLNSYYVYPIEWKGKQYHFDDILSADFIEPKHLVTASYDGDIVFWNTSTQNSSRKIANSKTKPASLPPLISSTSRLSSSRRRSARLSSSRLRGRSVNERSQILTNSSRDSPLPSKPSSPHALLRSPETCLNMSNNLAVTSISFLQARDNRDPNTADIYSCHADGYIRFWNSLTCDSVGEFSAFSQYGSIASCVDTSNTYLGVGGESGTCQIWNIAEYCLNTTDTVHGPMKHENHTPPVLVSTLGAHIDSVTCTRFIERTNLLLFLTASCDGSIAFYNFSTLIGIFGQEEHWNINDQKFLHVKTHEDENGGEGHQGNLSSQDISGDGPDVLSQCVESREDYQGKLETYLENTDVLAQPHSGGSELNTEASNDERVSSHVTAPKDSCADTCEVWDDTILGKAYQEERKSKRDRKQPYDLSAISTGIPTDKQTRSYRYLETKPMEELNVLEKPDFMIHPERYFLKKDDEEPKETIPLTIDNLKLRHDEKTIFPKHVIDKMKNASRLTNRPSVFTRLSIDQKLAKSSGFSKLIREAIANTKLIEE